MTSLEETDFPMGVAERIISTFGTDEDNIMDLKDLLYFVNNLTLDQLSNLINEIFEQIGV